MRVFFAPITLNMEVAPGVHLLEVHAPQLAQIVQPGQYCMLRCCDSKTSDPLLRRPFFVQEVDPASDLCRFLVYARGRASTWLTRQRAGMELDMLGPLGHGWSIRPATRNLLLIGEAPFFASVIALARYALEQELAVTLVSLVEPGVESYPAALLSPEIEYQIFSGGPGELAGQLKEYLAWADAVYCGVSRETLPVLTQADPRWQEKNFAQVALWEPLPCASGTCLSCQIETRHGARLICRAGPIFALSELADEKWPGDY